MVGGAWAAVKRLLVVRLDNIGDVVLLAPALSSLRSALPGAHITLLASPAGTQVAPLLPWVDEVLTARASWQALGKPDAFDRATELGLAERLASGRYGGALIFTSFRQSPHPPAYLCMLAGIPLRAAQSREFGGAALTHWVQPLPDGTHQAERNLHLLRSLGLPTPCTDLALEVPPAVQAAADGVLRAYGVDPSQPFVAVAPGASCQARTFDAARFAQVVQGVAQASGWPVVLLGTERERLAWEGAGAASIACAPVRLMGETSVPEFAAMIRRAALVLTSHSAALHLADAFNRPVVSPFAGTDLESQWRPRRSPVRLLRAATDCAPCYEQACPRQHECLDVAVSAIVAAALEVAGVRSTFGVRDA